MPKQLDPYTLHLLQAATTARDRLRCLLTEHRGATVESVAGDIGAVVGQLRMAIKGRPVRRAIRTETPWGMRGGQE